MARRTPTRCRTASGRRCLLRSRGSPRRIGRTEPSDRRRVATPMLLTATIDAVSPATPRASACAARSTPVRFRRRPGRARRRAGTGERRPYSIAVGPEEAARSGYLEFLIGLGEDGTPGPHLPSPRPASASTSKARSARSPSPTLRLNAVCSSSRAAAASRPSGRCCTTCWWAIAAGGCRSSTARARPRSWPSTTSSALARQTATITARRRAHRPAGDGWTGRIGRALLEAAVRHRPGDAVLRVRARVAGARGAAHAARARRRAARIRIEEWAARCRARLARTSERETRAARGRG